MFKREKPAEKGPGAPAAPPSQDKRLPSPPGGDPVAAAEDHLAGVDMAAQRAILRKLTS